MPHLFHFHASKTIFFNLQTSTLYLGVFICGHLPINPAFSYPHITVILCLNLVITLWLSILQLAAKRFHNLAINLRS